MTIAEKTLALLKETPQHVKIIAVSKTRSVEEIMEAYNAGIRDFGENKAQELVTKRPSLPGDIRWHFIGHLQTNKVKVILQCVHMIQSIDSIKLLRFVEKEAALLGIKVNCLLQFHIASEETKFGLDMSEAKALLQAVRDELMQHVRICGVMGMATFTENIPHVEKEFRLLRSYFDRIKSDYFLADNNFREISMGMSGDYPVAIRQGATMIRLGTVLFGEREYAS
jgi:pyridoxal phosphate enzyme (YggS family)